jgi:hypothetical protein
MVPVTCFAYGHLVRTAAREEPVARRGEGELEIWDRAGIGIRAGQVKASLGFFASVESPVLFV